MKKASSISTLGILMLGIGPWSAPAAFSLGEPVQVTLRHAPSFQMKLGTVCVDVLSDSQCGEQLGGKITEMFVNNNVTLVDRANLDKVLGEHKLNMSGYVDQATATQIGQMLGADALFLVRVSRCYTSAPKFSYETNSGLLGRYTVYHAKVDASVVFTWQTVDLRTGKILKARNIQKNWTADKYANDGYPEPPTEFEALDEAIAHSAAEVGHMYFPWEESIALRFFGESDYGMAMAHAMFQAGAFAKALAQSQAGLALCEKDARHSGKRLRHAEFNVAMCMFALEDYENALPMFQKAAVEDGGGDYEREGLAACETAISLKQDMLKYLEAEQRAAIGPARPQGGPGTEPAAGGAVNKPAQPASGSVEERLKKLEDLFKKGLITKSEYEKKKAEIIKEL